MTERHSPGARTSLARPLKVALIVLLTVAAVFVVGRGAIWGFSAVQMRSYDLMGRWTAEQAVLSGVALPIGPQLEFRPDSAVISGTSIPVTEYVREQERIHVALSSGAGVDINLTFRFEDADHIVYEGPLGLQLKYRRARGGP